MTEPIYIERSAAFDEHQVYRYLLTRAWGSGARVLWVMLNPSTADAEQLDPTLRRVLAFSRAWGFDGFEVCNAYALRSPDPDLLWRFDDPIGPHNDATIQAAAKRAELVIVGWGSNADRAREIEVAKLLADVGVMPMCLGTTKRGSPRHPLYLRSTTPREVWRPAWT